MLRPIRLCSVVASELFIHANPTGAARVQQLLATFSHAGIITPSHDAWVEAGRDMAVFARANWFRRNERWRRSFFFDVVVARTCAEHDCTLVTSDIEDRRRIQHVVGHVYRAP